jgi:murein DD-endopeptidase MepM/ murein hydrolase activator NlpD
MKQNNFFSKMKVQSMKFLKSMKNKNTNFFIIALCICLISTAIVWKYTRDNNNSIAKEDVKDPDPINAQSEDPYKDYVQNQIDDYQKALGDKSKKDTASQKSMLELFARPLSGKISREYNIKELLYFEAIEEWRTHQGLDIQADGNLNVYSSYDGTVEKVNKDSTMGIEIVINHGDDIFTLYSCLSSNAVNVGDKVQKSQKIGTLGVVENIEMSDVPHLHYEIIVKGKNYDPSSYYKE